MMFRNSKKLSSLPRVIPGSRDPEFGPFADLSDTTSLEFSINGSPLKPFARGGDDNFFILILLFLLIFPIRAYSGDSPQQKGRQIIDQQLEVNKGYHDEKYLGQMRLLDSRGGAVIREFEFKKLEETSNLGSKSLVIILKPADLSGTALLSFQNPKRSDDQWLYLPSLKKTKRIAGQGKSGRFIGSEFAYEDLLPPDTDKYTYTFLQAENCGAKKCHVIEAKPLFGDSAYSKTVTWIEEDRLQNVRVDFYNKKNQHQKTALFEDFRQLGGKFWRPFRVNMKDLRSGRETELLIKSAQVHAGLKSSDFTRAALER